MSGNEHDDFMGGLGGLQGLGIISALRTGDPAVDMVLAMCLPLLLRLLVQMAGDVHVRVTAWLYGQKKTQKRERIIEQQTQRTSWGSTNSLDSDSQNSVLMKAIVLYLHKVVRLELDEADVSLTSTEDKNSSVGQRNHYWYDDNDDDDDEDSKTVAGALSKYTVIKRPRPNQWYKLGEYGKLEPSNVDLIIEQNEEEGKESSPKTITKQFRLQADHGESIDHFVDSAYRWYLSELRKQEDHARYLYELKPTSSSFKQSDNDANDSSSSSPVFTRYRLSDEKTFNSLFFRQKESLLKLMGHFLDKTGKYAIEGYPHKLGILLHGPPGSGKTSMIKALAQRTGRSIVNVPLSRISTNAELMSVFFDRRKQVEGEGIPVKLGFKDVIFVMEDVDAASKIVKRRDGGKTADTVSQQQQQQQSIAVDLSSSTKSMWSMLLESNDDACKELVEFLLDKSEDLKGAAGDPSLALSTAKNVTLLPGLAVTGRAFWDDPGARRVHQDALETANQRLQDQSNLDNYLAKQARALLNLLQRGAPVDNALVQELLGTSFGQDYVSLASSGSTQLEGAATMAPAEAPAPAATTVLTEDPFTAQAIEGTTGTTTGPSLWGKLPKKDELNLSGLLNVLDGVVDSPGRIVIMTTNHVEHLDPALIRPGRIDKRLLLGYMEAPDVVQMLEHYFQTTLDKGQVGRVGRAMGQCNLRLTPAQIEQFTAEYDTVEEMVQTLEDMAGSSHDCIGQ